MHWTRRPELQHRVARRSRHGSAKLEEAAVAGIRRAYAGGGVSMRALAEEHGVAVSTVWLVVNEVTWR
jgi:hypothetical protein